MTSKRRKSSGGARRRRGQAPTPGQRDAPQEQSAAQAMPERGQQQQLPPDPFPALAAPPPRVPKAPRPSPQRPSPQRPTQAAAPQAAAPFPQSPPQAAGGDRFEMRKLAESLLVVPKKRDPFPRRPGEGKLGRSISVLANHFAMQLPNGDVFHYDVAILPPQRKEEAKAPDQKKMRALSTHINRRVIQQLVNKYRGELNKCLPAFDGRKNLYTRSKLPFDERIFFVDYEEEDPRPEGDRAQQFSVKIHYATTVNLDALHAVYNNQVRTVPQEVVQALDIIMRHGPCMQWTPVGRSIFMPPRPLDKNSLGGGQEVWFGYYTSVRPAQWKPMLNVDRSATAFYEEQTLLKFMVKLLSGGGNQFDPQTVISLEKGQISRLNKELKTVKVKAMHLPYPRKYRIVKITQEPAHKLKFKLDDGFETSVADYFKKKYPRFAAYPHLPCIMVGTSTRPVYVPIEACKIVKGQPYRRKLAPGMTKAMIKCTAQPPAQRFENIRLAVRDVVQKSQPYLNEFGIKISTELTQLNGRVLDAPTIVMKGNKTLQPRDGAWNLRNVQFHQAATVKTWMLLGMNIQLREKEIDWFIRLLQQTGRSLGMSVADPFAVRDEDSMRQKSSEILGEIKRRCPKVQLVVVVLGRNSSYADIKQAAETNLGMRTQCITQQNFIKNCNPQLMVNLCQKINAKMGGINNGLLPEQKPDIFSRPVIIIGADVSHPAPGDRIKPSIAACVGSLDPIPSKYQAAIRVQMEDREAVARVEMIQDLKGMVIELLMAFFRATRQKPEHIIFYRDGVSEGQFAEVRDMELQAIRDACLTLQLDGTYKPPITFIVVQKRHHTRFMPTNERDGVGRCRNVPPGTTVDSVVTHPVDFDFFLCSHYGIQGTSKPAHYYVLHDDNNFSPDDLQKLSYYLCHTYARCTRSVSIPAPVYYAHLAAFRAKEHIVSAVKISSATSESSAGDAGLSTVEYERAVALTEPMKEMMYFV